HITRIEKNVGRQDYRGHGFELRSDGHGAVRARHGLLVTTEARTGASGHVLDSGETVQRLTEARDLHESLADTAQQAGAQDPGKDQSDV
ncbi:type VI secretion system tip protein VgrG, partial [Stenotrophomonas maltophilia]